LLVVSDRLPFTVSSRDNNLVFHSCPGGLVSGLTAYLEWARRDPSRTDYLWVGWPGIEVEEGSRELLRTKAAEQNASPVFLDADTMKKFYQGFCNSTIWPLFHYFPTYAKFREEDWAQYVKVNEEFRDSILKVYQPNDTVWVHDYHLMLLPKLLREKLPDLSIGFFLHTPFPSYDVFRTLPTTWRREILEGILGADLIGFHTIDYTKGIKHRLEAYAIFLERYLQWQRKVVLVLSVVPSRLGAEQYEQMKEEIDKLVGGINGKFGTIDWTPIVYRYRFLPYNQLLS